MSSMLVREEDKRQRPIYYADKRLTGAEVRYSPMEKLAMELTTFDIEYRPRSTIKSPWMLAVDGSSTSGCGRAGLMIRGPDGQT